MTDIASAPSGSGRRSPSAVLRAVAPRISEGELGMIPVILALVLIGIVFQAANDNFLTARNLSYMTLQIGSLAVMTVGAVLVLLIGEIDLSIGSVSGFTASVMAVLAASHGFAGGWAILAALVVGLAIGALQGLWVVLVRAPSFIVTLTGLLVWQGAQQITLGPQGEQRITSTAINDIASTYMPTTVGLVVGITAAVGFAAYLLGRRYLRRRAGYEIGGSGADVVKIVLTSAVAIGVALLLNSFLGVPYLLVGVVAVTAVFGVATTTTPVGRHIYAVGGNAEAARRAGIRVGALRVGVFALVGLLAATGGIIDASRGFAVTVVSGGGNTTLDAIAAAVIGGTSLFGGRGRMVGALLGALVIGSVTNGLALLGKSAAAETIVTGLILIVAVSIDVTARRGAIGPNSFLTRIMRRGRHG